MQLCNPRTQTCCYTHDDHKWLKKGKAIHSYKGQKTNAQGSSREGRETMHVKRHAEYRGEDEPHRSSVHARECLSNMEG